MIAKEKPPTRVRALGAVKLVLGGIGNALILAFADLTDIDGDIGWLLALCIPGAVGLWGLVEMFTGVPILETERKWAAMKGWQRGLLGTAVILTVMTLIVAGAVWWGLKHP